MAFQFFEIVDMKRDTAFTAAGKYWLGYSTVRRPCVRHARIKNRLGRHIRRPPSASRLSSISSFNTAGLIVPRAARICWPYRFAFDKYDLAKRSR